MSPTRLMRSLLVPSIRPHFMAHLSEHYAMQRRTHLPVTLRNLPERRMKMAVQNPPSPPLKALTPRIPIRSTRLWTFNLPARWVLSQIFLHSLPRWRRTVPRMRVWECSPWTAFSTAVFGTTCSYLVRGFRFSFQGEVSMRLIAIIGQDIRTPWKD